MHGILSNKQNGEGDGEECCSKFLVKKTRINVHCTHHPSSAKIFLVELWNILINKKAQLTQREARDSLGI